MLRHDDGTTEAADLAAIDGEGLMTYEQAFCDHQYLWMTYSPAYDMSGGYVDQDDLARLLARPTKATARECLVNQIRYWFDVGPEDGNPPAILAATDPEIYEIAERHGVVL